MGGISATKTMIPWMDKATAPMLQVPLLQQPTMVSLLPVCHGMHLWWHLNFFLTKDGEAPQMPLMQLLTVLRFPISNNSWGGRVTDAKDIIAEAANKGHLFCAAAGNSTSNNDQSPHYPSNYDLPSVLSVAASNSSDKLAWFSSTSDIRPLTWLLREKVS